MWFKIKRRPADKLFSDYIRAKANWKCTNPACKYPYADYSDNHGGLEAAHYYGRRKEAVRFDTDNVHAVCKSCHKRFHEDKATHIAFMINKLGAVGFDRLMLRANQSGGKDDKMTILRIKEMIKDLK